MTNLTFTTVDAFLCAADDLCLYVDLDTLKVYDDADRLVGAWDGRTGYLNVEEMA